MIADLPIPDAFSRRTTELHGEKGRHWLSRLPELIGSARERWGLQLGRLAEPLSYGYVVEATAGDGRPCMLKAAVPSLEMDSEIAALRAFDGRGAALLYEEDAASGLMLLERLQPGGSLAALEDDERATAVAAEVMLQIRAHVPEEGPFPTTEDWAWGLNRLRARFGGGTGPLPSDLVDAAEILFRELHGSAAPPALLHGDLHHFNILEAGRRPWLAIDPKGVIGEPAYEAGALLRNPMPAIAGVTQLRAVLARRLDLLADKLELERDRLAGWAAAQAVLSGWWSLEDHGTGWEPSIACARELLALTPGRPWA